MKLFFQTNKNLNTILILFERVKIIHRNTRKFDALEEYHVVILCTILQRAIVRVYGRAIGELGEKMGMGIEPAGLKSKLGSCAGAQERRCFLAALRLLPRGTSTPRLKAPELGFIFSSAPNRDNARSAPPQWLFVVAHKNSGRLGALDPSAPHVHFVS